MSSYEGHRQSTSVIDPSVVLIMKLFATVLCLGAAALATSTEGNKKAECEMWSKLENKTLPLQNQGHANCTTNPDCTGFSCKGIYQEKDISFGMRALPCKSPPGVEIFGYAPQYNTQHFSHIFTHKAEYQVPGALFNFKDLLANGEGVKPGLEFKKSQLRGVLEVHLKMNHNQNTLTMGLNAKACLDEKTCIFNKPVFNNTEIPVPDCPNDIPTEAPELSNTKVNSQCLMTDIAPCGENMLCSQIEAGSSKGVCSCLQGYSVQDDLSCLSIQEEEKAGEKKEEEEVQEAEVDPEEIEQEEVTTEEARVESEEAATTTLKPRQHVVVDDSDLETEQQRQRVIELSKTILENDQQLESEEGEGDAVQRPKKSLTSSGSSASEGVELPRQHITSINTDAVTSDGVSSKEDDFSLRRRTRGSGAIAAVVISLLAVLLVGASIIGVVMRTSYGTRLRARLRQAPYGDIVIGGSPVRSVAPGSASSSTHPATSSGITQLGSTTTLA